jgi:hypothetical protein
MALIWETMKNTSLSNITMNTKKYIKILSRKNSLLKLIAPLVKEFQLIFHQLFPLLRIS